MLRAQPCRLLFYSIPLTNVVSYVLAVLDIIAYFSHKCEQFDGSAKSKTQVTCMNFRAMLNVG